MGPSERGQSSATTFLMAGLSPIQGRTPRLCLPPDNVPGREVIYSGSLHAHPGQRKLVPKSVVVWAPPKVGYTGVLEPQMSMSEVLERYAPSSFSVH